jgi:hypothetical protein
LAEGAKKTASQSNFRFPKKHEFMKSVAMPNMPVSDVNTGFYTYEEVLKRCLEYFGGDELAATTWINKYAMKDTLGRFVELTPADMHRRMAREFARIEDYYRRSGGGTGRMVTSDMILTMSSEQAPEITKAFNEAMRRWMR